MARRKRAEHHEEHMDEGWLLPYSDLMTLLLALFIVLFASSQVDQKKVAKMAEAFNAAFNSSGSAAAILDDSPSMVEPTAEKDMPQNEDLSKKQKQMQENAQLLDLKKGIDQYIVENNLSKKLHTVLSEDGLLIRIRDSALFPSGSAELIPGSRQFGSQIAKMLKNIPQKVVISGHTDNVPISNGQFPSNWELSSLRAINFMKYLLDQDALPPERFSAIGYGQYRPIADNSTPEGKAKNRRVEVLIMRNYKM